MKLTAFQYGKTEISQRMAFQNGDLRKYGVIPYEITDVLITHSHNDHIGCLNYYQNADIYIQEYRKECYKKHIVSRSYR